MTGLVKNQPRIFVYWNDHLINIKKARQYRAAIEWVIKTLLNSIALLLLIYVTICIFCSYINGMGARGQFFVNGCRP